MMTSKPGDHIGCDWFQGTTLVTADILLLVSRPNMTFSSSWRRAPMEGVVSMERNMFSCCMLQKNFQVYYSREVDRRSL